MHHKLLRCQRVRIIKNARLIAASIGHDQTLPVARLERTL
jgi:hypothetical protein